jgi:hypothetical protein
VLVKDGRGTDGQAIAKKQHKGVGTSSAANNVRACVRACTRIGELGHYYDDLDPLSSDAEFRNSPAASIVAALVATLISSCRSATRLPSSFRRRDLGLER